MERIFRIFYVDFAGGAMEIDSEAAVDITTTTTTQIRAEDVEMGHATANNEKEK